MVSEHISSCRLKCLDTKCSIDPYLFYIMHLEFNLTLTLLFTLLEKPMQATKFLNSCELKTGSFVSGFSLCCIVVISVGFGDKKTW